MSFTIKIKASLLFLLCCHCLIFRGAFYSPTLVSLSTLVHFLGILGNSLEWTASDRLLIFWLLVELGQWDALRKKKKRGKRKRGASHGAVEPTCQCKRHKRRWFDPWVGKIPWSRQPTPVFLPGKSHGQRSLVCCSLWGCKELYMTEWAYRANERRWRVFIPVVPSLPSSSLVTTLFLSGIQQLLWEVLPYFSFHWVPITALSPSPTCTYSNLDLFKVQEME